MSTDWVDGQEKKKRRIVCAIKIHANPHKRAQKMQTQPGNLGEISVKLARSRRDLGEICIVAEISPRSRRDKRDLAEMTEISLQILCHAFSYVAALMI